MLASRMRIESSHRVIKKEEEGPGYEVDRGLGGHLLPTWLSLLLSRINLVISMNVEIV